MFKLINFIAGALLVSLFAQHLSYVFLSAEARVYDQKRSTYASPQSYVPNARNQYQSMEPGLAAGRYGAHNSLIGNIPRRGENEECSSDGGNQTHMYTVTIP